MPLNVLKELGGWADLTMVMRYAYLSSDRLTEYASNSIPIVKPVLSLINGGKVTN
ncbi:hypothetical protein CRENPOLYSF1_830004 [Crenothrix polyspora]|uniref:Integrase n=1 Tax=Crenothrix polyspora TaxID=360316 RepID=A0A1R4HJD7_9GAMM|nr:hypothetical protein CRENPOLYSF1_830004 [Crenothrix polyspora]